MCHIDYEAAHRRLRVAGRCRAGDADAVRDAIDVFGRRGETLIVDLTALTTCAEEVAHAVLDSAESLASCRVTVLRKHGTEVDQLLSAPRSER